MIKKIISKLMPANSIAERMAFFKWLDRDQKIKRLGRKLEGINHSVEKAGFVTYDDFKEIYHLAQLQQKLLTIK